MDINAIISHCFASVYLPEENCVRYKYLATIINDRLLLLSSWLEESAYPDYLEAPNMEYVLGELIIEESVDAVSRERPMIILHSDRDLGYRGPKHHEMKKCDHKCDYKQTLFKLLDADLLPTKDYDQMNAEIVGIRTYIVGEKVLTVDINTHNRNIKLSLPNDVSLSWPDEEDEYWAEQGFEQGYIGRELSSQVRNYCNLFADYNSQAKSARFTK